MNSTGDYYDIHDILAECQQLKCTFKTDVVDMGYLDVSNDSNKDLNIGSVLKLPYWLASPLHKRNMIDIDVPTYYTSKVFEQVLIDPCVINLRSKNEYYYLLGLKIGLLINSSHLSLWMSQCLHSRYSNIILEYSHYNHSNNRINHSNPHSNSHSHMSQSRHIHSGTRRSGGHGYGYDRSSHSSGHSRASSSASNISKYEYYYKNRLSHLECVLFNIKYQSEKYLHLWKNNQKDIQYIQSKRRRRQRISLGTGMRAIRPSRSSAGAASMPRMSGNYRRDRDMGREGRKRPFSEI